MAESRIEAATRLLGEARDAGRLLDALPAELTPADEAEAYAIHRSVVARRGAVAGWKVGAASPDAAPGVGEITADTIFSSPAQFEAGAFRLWAVEAEIAVTLGADLPAREKPYDAAEVFAAVASWHAAIEVLDTCLPDWASAPAVWRIADRQSHGALVLGPAVAKAPKTLLGELPVLLSVDGEPVFAHRGGNTAGDPTRLLVHLANAQRETGRPLARGDVITTGSTTPFLQGRAGQRVRAEFDELGGAELSIGG